MPFHVTLMPSGHAFDVKDGQTILDAGLAAGHALPYSCRTGVCSTCKGRIARGEISHGLTLESRLGQAERAQGHALLCSARPRSDLVVEVRELAGVIAIPPKRYPCRLHKLERPAPDVAILTLRLPPNDHLRYLAGQYIELSTAAGERRCYSIASPPDPSGQPFIELHVRHVPGGVFTDHVFTRARERDLLTLEGPFGTCFVRDDSTRPIVLLAGGTGFAPAKAMIEHAIRCGSTRPMALYWGGRTRRDLYATATIAAWQAPHLTFTPVLSEPDPSWTGRTGLVHHAVMHDLPDLSGHQVYACGSPRMVDAARRDFTARCALPPDELFADAFLTAADKAT